MTQIQGINLSHNFYEIPENFNCVCTEIDQ